MLLIYPWENCVILVGNLKYIIHKYLIQINATLGLSVTLLLGG